MIGQIFFLSILTIVDISVKADELVMCYEGQSCDGAVTFNTTIVDCCDNQMQPVGRSYQHTVNDTVIDECQSCPVVFGFYQMTFSGLERGQPHSVQAGFLSGSVSSPVEFDVELTLGTARESDVRLVSTHRIVFADSVLVSFILTVDGIAQEESETFTLSLTNISPALSGAVVIHDTLSGVILDRDEVLFTFSEDDYRANEMPNASMPSKISKHDALLANPVWFRVTPLTVQQALDRNVISHFEPEDLISPKRANEDDFDVSVRTVMFPADEDESTPINSISVPIPITDDELDEASEQVFIAYLEVINTTNRDLLISDVLNVSTCTIVDNDPIRIGFVQQTYEFREPESETLITNVTLIKENGRQSEQTFSILISITEPVLTPPAQIQTQDTLVEYDYRLTDGAVGATFTFREFLPDMQAINFTFFVNSDTVFEGVEGFRASSTPLEGYPTFLAPVVGSNTAFQTTEILILDNEIAVVGFESKSYSVSEEEGSLEVCVTVTNPPPNQDLIFNIYLVYQTRTCTADAGDFAEVGASSGSTVFLASPASSNSTPRRNCFMIDIIDDEVVESVESFTLVLDLEPFQVQSAVLVQPNVTVISIIDDDRFTSPANSAPITTPTQANTTPTCPPCDNTTNIPLVASLIILSMLSVVTTGVYWSRYISLRLQLQELSRDYAKLLMKERRGGAVESAVQIELLDDSCSSTVSSEDELEMKLDFDRLSIDMEVYATGGMGAQERRVTEFADQENYRQMRQVEKFGAVNSWPSDGDEMSRNLFVTGEEESQTDL